MNSVSCLAWVKKGAAKRRPDRAVLNDEELKRVIDTQSDKLKMLEVGENSDSERESEELKHKSAATKEKKTDESGEGSSKRKHDSEATADEDADVIDKYGLDDYDEDDKEEEDDDEEDGDGGFGMGGIAYYGSNKDDPYINREHKDDSDDEDLEVLPDDNLIAVGKVRGDFCNLEVHLYNEKDNNLYCHHDILLSSFPLALEWLDYDPGDPSPGNLVAMGTMLPDIEIWDLDVVDAIEPAYVLKGSEVKVSKKKKKKTSSSGHTDAVLDLSWNKNQRKVLASASADFSVGIWDLEQGVMATSLTHHTEKVQSVAWHPVEAQTLASGSFDHTARVYDCRSPEDGQKFWTLAGEVERVIWNHHSPYNFLASTESGHVYGIDVRETKPLFTLQAHSTAVTGLSLSPTIPGCMVTTSADKILRVWDIRANTPVQVHKKQMSMGELHCVSCSSDSPLVVGIGGERELRVVNLQRNADICKHFNMTQLEPSARDRRRERSGVDDEDSDDEGIGEVHDSSEEERETSAAAAAEQEGATNKKKKHKKKKKKPRTSSLNRANNS